MRWNAKGFNTMELLVVCSVFAVIALAMTTFFTSLWTGGEAAQVRSDGETQAHLALQVIARDIRHATNSAAGSPPNIVIAPPPGNTSLTLYLPSDLDSDGDIVDDTGAIEWDSANPIVFQLDGATNQIQRVEGGDVRVLANDATLLQFEDITMNATLRMNEVRILVQIGKRTNRGLEFDAGLSGVVQLRN